MLVGKRVIGSPVSDVAPEVVPLHVPLAPETTVAFAKASLPGAAWAAVARITAAAAVTANPTTRMQGRKPDLHR
jgi:hypothetical protein